MRVVLQRVLKASVSVDGRCVGSIDRGLLLLVGLMRGDTASLGTALAQRIAGLRVFEDAEGRTNLAIDAVGGRVLAISQFTLAADTSRGRRPGFERAMPAAEALPLFDHFVAALAAALQTPVATGVFGASMQVELINDGPFTLILEQNEAGE